MSSVSAGGSADRDTEPVPGRCRFRAESSAQDTNWTEPAIGSGEELRAADRAGARFLLR
jgi:hypothetical protein